MLETIGSALAGLAILVLIVGLINPNWVLFGNINKTRGKVIAVYSFVFIFAIGVQIIGSPNSFETGKKAFLEKNYDYAITKLENIESADKNYTEAQALLKQARTLLWPSMFEKAKIAASNQQYSQVISLLSDYPADEKGFAEASKLLKYAEEKLEEEQHQKQVDQEAQKIESEHIEEIKSAEKERKKALVDYPECDSSEATENVISVLADSPLGRAHGYSLIKLNNATEVSAVLTERKCEGYALLNDGNKYPISFRFYRDGDDILVQAQILGLE